MKGWPISIGPACNCMRANCQMCLDITTQSIHLALSFLLFFFHFILFHLVFLIPFVCLYGKHIRDNIAANTKEKERKSLSLLLSSRPSSGRNELGMVSLLSIRLQ